MRRIERGGERERERERERELVETVELLSQRHQLALCRGEETERERESYDGCVLTRLCWRLLRLVAFGNRTGLEVTNASPVGVGGRERQRRRRFY